MNGIVNIGNTNTKLALFSDRQMMDNTVFPNERADEIQRYLDEQRATKYILSATKEVPEELLQQLTKYGSVLEVDDTTALPFAVEYDSRETLGDDRIAAVAGARFLAQDTDLLVITSGTCITYNLFTLENGLLGGGISPGVAMRYLAMNVFTGQLPLVKNDSFDELVGRSTKESLQSGVRRGIVAEVDGIITQYKLLYPKLQVFICGGSTNFFERRLKNKIFAHPNLELIGMNELLMYNYTTE